MDNIHLQSVISRLILPILLAVAMQVAPFNRQVAEELDRADLALALDRPAQSVISLHQITKFEPWRTSEWISIARLEYKAGNYAQALSAYHQAGAFQPVTGGDRLQLGYAYQIQGEWPSALNTWQPLLVDGSAPEDLYMRVVNFHRTNHDYISAAQAAGLWYAAHPESPEALYQKTLMTLMIEPDAADQLLLDLSRREQPYSGRADALQKGVVTGKLSGDPAYSEVNLGRTLAALNAWDLAQNKFEKVVNAVPDYAEGWALLSEAMQQNGKDGGVEIRKAYSLNPDSPLVLSLYARYWRQNGRSDVALAYLYRSAQREPGSAVWQIELGSTLVDLGELNLALQHYQRASEFEPNNLTYLETLGRFCIQYQIEARSIGLPTARHILTLAPEDPGALDFMGWVLLNLGDFSSAERFLQLAVQKDARDPSILLHLGQVYVQKNEPQKAVPLFSMASSLGSERDPAVVVARRLLEQVVEMGR
jgi:tetratricopeptide (TPR) repeat protein